MLPVLTYTRPRAVADALRWRHATLDLARDRARSLGLRGRGVPVAHDPRRGVLGLLARRHGRVPHQRRDRRRGRCATTTSTEDEEFEREAGVELLVETARLWRSLGHHDAAGQLPDRRRHRAGRVQRDRRQQRLHEPDGAAEPARRGRRGRAPSRSGPPQLGVDDEETAQLARRRRRRCSSPTTRRSASTRRRRDSPSTRSGTSTRPSPTSIRCCCTIPYFDLYRKQVVKQADLVLALYRCGERFTAEEKARDFAYYERADRPRLVAVGVHPGGRRRRGRAPRAGLRLLRRGRAARPRRPRAQHPRRRPHRLASGLVHRRGRRLRRRCASHDGTVSFAPRLPGALTRLAFQAPLPRAESSMVEVTPPPRDLHVARAASRSRSATTARS